MRREQNGAPEHGGRAEQFLRVLFTVYLILLLMVVIVKFDGHLDTLRGRIQYMEENRRQGIWNLNIIPGETIRLYLRYIHHDFAKRNLLANVFAFVPLGYLLPRTHHRFQRLWKTFAFSFLFLLLIEIFQFVTLLGVFDIDDLILNLFGCLLGYGLFRLRDAIPKKLRRYRPKKENGCR